MGREGLVEREAENATVDGATTDDDDDDDCGGGEEDDGGKPPPAANVAAILFAEAAIVSLDSRTPLGRLSGC